MTRSKKPSSTQLAKGTRDTQAWYPFIIYLRTRVMRRGELRHDSSAFGFTLQSTPPPLNMHPGNSESFRHDPPSDVPLMFQTSPLHESSRSLSLKRSYSLLLRTRSGASSQTLITSKTSSPLVFLLQYIQQQRHQSSTGYPSRWTARPTPIRATFRSL